MRALVFVFLFLIAKGELVTYHSLGGHPYTVTYDHRSFFINGTRTLLLSGSVHYPRSTPAMWPSIFDLAVKNGLNTIQTYVFWNFHEAERGVYDFSGRGDLVQFIEQAAARNLFVNLRIGPYVCAEWDYGGFPLWLRDIPDIHFRTYNKPFMNEMARFMQYIVNMTRPFLASAGGNIILAQVENEYNPVEDNAPAIAYTQWCGQLAESLDVGVPWVMCNGEYANNTIETCNSCDCDTWIASHWTEQPNTPAAWTENEGWFDMWGIAPLIRTSASVAYSVARFVAYGGTYHNYYMWHGGNNYGITGAASVTARYANDVMVDSMALPHEPKFSFVGALHNLLAKYSETLLKQNPPTPYYFSSSVDYLDYGEISFLSNNNSVNATSTFLHGKSFYLPPTSVIILDSELNILFNTSDVSDLSIPHKVSIAESNFNWISFTEPEGVTQKNVIRNPTPLEHLAISLDKTDYVWYSAPVNIQSSADFLEVVSIMSHAFSVYVDGQFLGANWDTTKACCDLVTINVNFTQPVQVGSHQIDILSTSLGIENGGVAMETFTKGIMGSVMLGSNNITSIQGEWWTMQQGLIGEQLQIYIPENSDNVNWTAHLPSDLTPKTWYSTTFATPTAPGTVALDITGLGKGHAYVNGNDIGRYWSLVGKGCGVAYNDCFNFTSVDCNSPTQSLYHIPPDWLLPSHNTLVIFEELGAPDISTVSIVTITP